VTSLQLGCTALAAGRLGGAVRWLAEAQAGLRQRDPLGLLPLCTAKLVQACALADSSVPGGRPPAATLARHRAVTVFEPELLLAESLLSAGSHQRAQAVERADQAADAAAATGQWGVQSGALHTIVRLGHAARVTNRMRRLAGQADGPLAAAFLAHAEAAAGNVAWRLEEIAADFEAMGALLHAAESAAQAAGAYELSGDRQRRAAASARALRLAGICGTARTLALGQLTSPALTTREQEVAGLAGVGLSNRAIADRLVVSVHTVETHLARSYAKLGITRRRELPEALGRSGQGAGETGVRRADG
jgi:ATP/maltotriose-dependent transcriptional regulator MalT